MKITREALEKQGAATGGALAAFTLDVIRPVRDFTARKTLEQAHAFVTGLAEIFAGARTDDDASRIARDLERIGIDATHAEEVAAQALLLIESMADRDREADVFHAAVREAGQRERAMYERLAGVARALRRELGQRSPALSRFGVPPESTVATARARAPGLAKAGLSAAMPAK